MTNKTSDDHDFASDDEDFADYTDDHQHKSPPDAAAVEEGRTPDVADSPETEPPD